MVDYKQYKSEWYHRNKEKVVEQRKIVRTRYKELGLCYRCGRDRGDSPLKKCTRCTLRYPHRNMTVRERFTRKLKVFEAYGGIFCKCCNEKNPAFLSIDHIANNGAEHRRTMWKTPQKKVGGGNIYAWLAARKYPSGFQVLCHNCNMGKQINKGICPHILQPKEMWACQ